MPPKKRLLGISLKMYFTPTETSTYITALTHIPLPPSLQLFIIPDFLSLPTTSQILYPSPTTTTPSPILLGAQNCFWENSGPYTGEISPQHLKHIGCSIVELGHAERRSLFGETDEIVAKKAVAVLRNGMIPLVCIGEKNHGTVGEAILEIKPQVLSILEATREWHDAEMIFAYEPVWAIGQASPASAEYVTEVTKELRKLCGDRGNGIRIIYGGSAGRGTFAKIAEGVDGLFLGRFAHDVDALKDIINEVATS